MKGLKRTLAVALTVVMLIGMLSICTSAVTPESGYEIQVKCTTNTADLGLIGQMAGIMSTYQLGTNEFWMTFEAKTPAKLSTMTVAFKVDTTQLQVVNPTTGAVLDWSTVTGNGLQFSAGVSPDMSTYNTQTFTFKPMDNAQWKTMQVTVSPSTAQNSDGSFLMTSVARFKAINGVDSLSSTAIQILTKDEANGKGISAVASLAQDQNHQYAYLPMSDSAIGTTYNGYLAAPSLTHPGSGNVVKEAAKLMSVSDNTGLTYDGTAHVPTFTVKKGAAGDGAALTAGTDYTVTYKNKATGEPVAAVDVKNAGTYTYTIESATYNISGTLTGEFTIAKASQSALNITSANTVEYGSALTLAASGGSTSGTVTWAITDGSDKATIANGVLTPKTGNGTIKVKATMAGNENYNAVDSSEQTITLSKKSLTGFTATDDTAVVNTPKTLNTTITFNGLSETATAGTDYTVSYAVKTVGTTGLSTGAASSVTATAAGTATITATVSLTGDFANKYTLTSNTADFTLTVSEGETNTVTFTAKPENVTYGDTAMVKATGKGAITYTSSATDVATVDATGKITALKVGTTTITANAAGGNVGGTVYAPGTNSYTLTVDAATLTGTPAELTGTVSEAGKHLSDVLADNASATIGGVAGTFVWNDADTTEIEQGVAYDWTFTITDPSNYTSSTVTGSYTPWAANNSGVVGTNKVTVTFKAGKHGTFKNGKTTMTDTIKSGATADAPKVIADDGYKFLGWTVNGKKIVDPDDMELSRNTTFTALYEEIGASVSGETYIGGLGNGKFGPQARATRAQLAAMLARLSKGFDENGSYSGTASDLMSGQWYTTAMQYALETGIMTGYSDGTVRPNQNVTRAEFAAMLARYMGIEEVADGTFSDVSGWAAGYINALQAKDIVGGYNGKFRPNDELTRAEAVKMINLAVGLKYDAGYDYTTSFTDVARSAWYYEFVIPAANVPISEIVG